MWIVSTLKGYYPNVKEFDDESEALKEYKFQCENKFDDEKVYLAKVEKSEEGVDFCLDEHQ